MQPIAIPRQVSYAIRAAREKAGRTQGELAESAGVSRQLVIRLEAGRAPGIQLDKLMAVLDALDLHLFVAPGKADDPDGTTPPIERPARQGALYDEVFGQLLQESTVDASLFAPCNGRRA